MVSLRQWLVMMTVNVVIDCTSKGQSEYPLLRYWQNKGLSVGLVRRYRLPTYSTCKTNIRCAVITHILRWRNVLFV